MNWIPWLFGLWTFLVTGGVLLGSEPVQIRAVWTETSTRLSIVGSPKEDWFLESSGDLISWERDPASAPLASGSEAGAPERTLPRSDPAPRRFLRARRTQGLFDGAVMRTLHLRFQQPDWNDLLFQAHGTTSNVPGRLEVDNGRILDGVGARYRGYSSFFASGPKKSINLTLDHLNPENRLLGFESVNLNNGFLDPTLIREPLFFTAFRRHAPSPRAALARVFINDQNRGVYSMAQQADRDLLREWFPSDSGDRWMTPSTRGSSSLVWLGTNRVAYEPGYELKSTANTNTAWNRLLTAIEVLDKDPATGDPALLEKHFAVDDWLWFLALENVFADDDSYWKKGSDYGFYFEPEGGRFHPLQHDGNESFNLGHVELSPVEGESDPTRPILRRFLSVPEWRQRYLAHIRTLLDDSLHPGILLPEIDRWIALGEPTILADPIRGTSDDEYRQGVTQLKTFVTQRHAFLKAHKELAVTPPLILSVSTPPSPTPASGVVLRAQVSGGIPGRKLDSVWLHHRAGPVGRFLRSQMWDDGNHDDGAPGDGLHAVALPAFPAGTRVAYYVEARAADGVRTTSFHPAGTERGALVYSVVPAQGGSSPVRINELVADNVSVLKDPQGQHDDYVELWNSSTQTVFLGGCYLSDDPAEPRKWRFPEDVSLAPGAYLLVWLDGDVGDAPGLHAGFKLDRDGETLLLVDRDDRFNALLDSTSFGPLLNDQAWGRPASQPDTFEIQTPSPGAPNP